MKKKETKWLDIHISDNGYESVTHKINDGAGTIAIIPIRTDEFGPYAKNTAEVLVRKEPHNPWQLAPHEKDHYVAITGMIEPGETPKEAARRELHEETGYLIPEGEIIPLIWVGYQSKHDRDRHYIFVKRINALEPEEITTDGTEGERLASNHWIRFSRIAFPITFDMSLFAAYSYLLNFSQYE